MICTYKIGISWPPSFFMTAALLLKFNIPRKNQREIAGRICFFIFIGKFCFIRYRVFMAIQGLLMFISIVSEFGGFLWPLELKKCFENLYTHIIHTHVP